MRRPALLLLPSLLLAACGPSRSDTTPAPAGPPTAPEPAARAPGELSDAERQIVQAIDADQEHALALLEKAVNINSGTMNLAGVRQVGALFGAELEPLGFQVRWVDGAPFQRAGHLVAERKGSGPKVLLVGHLDTVFEPDSPFQRFERLGPHAVRGPGITDMKGGNVIIVSAMRALGSLGLLDRLHVVIVMGGDEESAGEPQAAARAALLEAAAGAAAAIGFEDGDGDPKTVVIGRRGTMGWTVQVKGTPAHSSQIFREDIGYGAVYEAARILDGFRTQLAGRPNLTLNPGLALAGTQVDHAAAESRGAAFGKDNVIAERALLSGDLRALTPEQFASARQTMTAIVADSLPGTSAEISFEEGYPPLAPTDGNRRLLAMYDQVSLDLGLGPVVAVDPDKAGAADVSFLAGRVPMIIDGVGLMGTGGHTVEETADMRTLPTQTRRAAILLHRLAGSARP